MELELDHTLVVIRLVTLAHPTIDTNMNPFDFCQ